MFNANENKTLEERVTALENSLYTPDVRLSIKQFCGMLNITPYRLKKLFEEYALPIQAPYRKGGKQPSYSLTDVKVCKQMLINAGEI